MRGPPRPPSPPPPPLSPSSSPSADANLRRCRTPEKINLKSGLSSTNQASKAKHKQEALSDSPSCTFLSKHKSVRRASGHLPHLDPCCCIWSRCCFRRAPNREAGRPSSTPFFMAPHLLFLGCSYKIDPYLFKLHLRFLTGWYICSQTRLC